MLGIHPLSAFELETPGLVEGALSTAATIAGVPLASLALAGGQPPAQYPELAAALESSWSVVAPLRLTPTLEAVASGSFSLTAARPATPTTAMRASADMSLQSVLARLNVTTSVALRSSAGASFSLAPYTVQLPHSIAAAPSFALVASGHLVVPAVLAAEAAASWGVAPLHLPIQPTLRAAPAVDLSVQTAYMNTTPAMRASASLESSVVPYLNRAAGMRASLSYGVTASAGRISKEQHLASNPLISLSVFAERPLILSHALVAYTSVVFDGQAVAPTLLPHVPLPPLEGFAAVQVAFPGRLVVQGSEHSYRALEVPAAVMADETLVSTPGVLAGVVEAVSSSSIDASTARTAVVTTPQAEDANE